MTRARDGANTQHFVPSKLTFPNGAGGGKGSSHCWVRCWWTGVGGGSGVGDGKGQSDSEFWVVDLLHLAWVLLVLKRSNLHTAMEWIPMIVRWVDLGAGGEGWGCGQGWVCEGLWGCVARDVGEGCL